MPTPSKVWARARTFAQAAYRAAASERRTSNAERRSETNSPALFHRDEVKQILA